MFKENRSIERRLNKIDKRLAVLHHVEHDYIKDNLRRLVFYNFLIGLSRGLGTAFGFTVLGALVIYTLQKIVLLNLPGISKWIAEIIKLVETYQ